MLANNFGFLSKKNSLTPPPPYSKKKEQIFFQIWILCQIKKIHSPPLPSHTHTQRKKLTIDLISVYKASELVHSRKLIFCNILQEHFERLRGAVAEQLDVLDYNRTNLKVVGMRVHSRPASD